MFFLYTYTVFYFIMIKLINLSLQKNVFVSVHEKRSNKKITLVTVQYQTVKSVIQWKKH